VDHCGIKKPQHLIVNKISLYQHANT